jgi:hypothetical protein
VRQLADFLPISLANPLLPPGLRGQAQGQNDAKRPFLGDNDAVKLSESILAPVRDNLPYRQEPE